MVAASLLSQPIAAQQAVRPRRVSVLMSLAQGDAVGLARIATLQSALREFGWSAGGNLEFEIRWGASEVALMRKHAAELVGAAPDVIVAHASATTAALQQATRTIPIVFVQGVDPVGAGFVESLARPGGNITGFSSREYQTSGKWLELLREVAPRVTQVGVLRDLTIAAGVGQLGAIHAAAAGSGVQVRPVGISSAAETERATSRASRMRDSS
jgi:putative ABC transport system substrate-binding protein